MKKILAAFGIASLLLVAEPAFGVDRGHGRGVKTRKVKSKKPKKQKQRKPPQSRHRHSLIQAPGASAGAGSSFARVIPPGRSESAPASPEKTT